MHAGSVDTLVDVSTENSDAQLSSLSSVTSTTTSDTSANTSYVIGVKHSAMESVKSAQPTPPNGFISCVEEETGLKISLQENSAIQGIPLDTDCKLGDTKKPCCLDSGINSANELTSDTTSSSPGLSAGSSVHEFCDSDIASKDADSNQYSPCQEESSTVYQSSSVETVSTSLEKLQLDTKSIPLQTDSERDVDNGLEYVVYESELQMPDIMRLITKDLSEPYSIYTYRYFIHNWPKLCFLVCIPTYT